MIASECQRCGMPVVRGGSVPGRYCSRRCAGDARREAKGVTKAWLEEKYLKDGLGTVRIARLVNRHPKRVYEWLVDYGIPLREKWHGNIPADKPYHNPGWLRQAYEGGKTLADIAHECGSVPGTVFRYMVRFGIETRSSYESCLLAGTAPDLHGIKNPMYGKRGPLSVNWKGGCTPERQAFYSSQEWIDVAKKVWGRDRAACQRCGVRKRHKDEEYCIHHLVSFAVEALRADLDNLILLCKACHLWVHSNDNTAREFIRAWEDTPRERIDAG